MGADRRRQASLGGSRLYELIFFKTFFKNIPICVGQSKISTYVRDAKSFIFYREAEESAFAMRRTGIFYVGNVLVIYGGFHYPCIRCNGVCEPHDKDF